MHKPRFPDSLPADAFAPARAKTAADAPDADESAIDFTPVPRLRVRRSGWTEDRQRGYIAALARCGSVSAAAKHVGMTARTAYKLLDAPGAESFAAAWDAAIDVGFAKVEIDALDRALNGSFVPIYRRGKLSRVEHRRNDRLAVAILSGNYERIEPFRASAVSRYQHGADLRDLDGLRDERAARLAEVEQDYHASVDRLVQTLEDRIAERAAAEPRILQL